MSESSVQTNNPWLQRVLQVESEGLHWMKQRANPILPFFHVQTTLRRRTQLADCVVRDEIGRCAESDTTNTSKRNATRQDFHTPAVHRHHFSLRLLPFNMLSAQEA